MSGSDDETLPIDRGQDDFDDGAAETDAGLEFHDEGAPEVAGRRIGSYRILRELGHGGQGVVFAAEDERLKRRVALKFLSSAAALSEGARLRFLREAETASRIEHPGIARVYELGDVEGTPYIAMEFIEGRSLSALIQKRCASESTEATLVTGSARGDRLARDLELIESLARALHVAHEAGLVHRDMKPGNVMVREDGSPCILDFGLVRDDSGTETTLTQSGDIVGTPSYMPPEQIRGRREQIDRRSDVYALGVTLYELILGRRPFEAPTREQLYQAILTREPQRPRSIDAKLPRDLEAIILTAIDKDRDRRYPTAEALADDLRRFRDHEPVVARAAGPILRGLRAVRRHPVESTLIILLMFALIAAAAIFYVKSEQAQRETRAKSRALAERERALDDFERLADVSRLEQAMSEVSEFFPPSPDVIEPIKNWLERHEPLHDRLARHRDLIETLRASAVSKADGSFDFGERDELRFLHDVMTKHVENLERFGGKGGQLAEMRQVLALSRAIRPATVESKQEAWDAAAKRVRENARYGGLELEPQLGLIPLGPDPHSGLEEFLLWLSHEGPEPERDADGDLPVKARNGVVLVLLPGATFLMGAQSDFPERPRYEPATRSDEVPVNEVTLEPFFLARHEFTQGQFERLTGINPSVYPAGNIASSFMTRPIDRRHPVEHVNWLEAMEVSRRLGGSLPTEAEWEYAARAGTDQRWSGASKLEELPLAANIGGAEIAPIAESEEPDLRDPHVLHAPVGSYRANAFGLHDMSGNVWEWCLDELSDYATPAKLRRGLRVEPPTLTLHIIRGGSFITPSEPARCARRDRDTAEYRAYDVGFRVARQLDR